MKLFIPILVLLFGAATVMAQTAHVITHNKVTIVCDAQKGEKSFKEWGVFPSEKQDVRRIFMNLTLAYPTDRPIAHWDYIDRVKLLRKGGKKGELLPPRSSGILNEITGAFVSVYVNGKLRGCIGGFARKKTLNNLVQDMAISASCDRRFDPIKPDELKKMELEISVLSPLKKIGCANEIELGKHGVYIKKGQSSGTFLPQVATKTGWNLEEFLGHCSRDKAGLGWDGWKTADLFTYEAIIFRSTST